MVRKDLVDFAYSELKKGKSEYEVKLEMEKSGWDDYSYERDYSIKEAHKKLEKEDSLYAWKRHYGQYWEMYFLFGVVILFVLVFLLLDLQK
ncbi:MAG: hypothetical protein ACE5DI_02880 [Candidatus Micrarchaeia archaeon]